jgi:hypothetical protein
LKWLISPLTYQYLALSLVFMTPFGKGAIAGWRRILCAGKERDGDAASAQGTVRPTHSHSQTASISKQFGEMIELLFDYS